MTVEAIPLRQCVACLDSKRVPLNNEERATMQGDVPYWGANGIVDCVDRALFDEELVLIGEDGAPFDNQLASVAFLVREPVWVNNHIHVLRPRPGIDARYLTYALNSIDWMPFLTGATRLKLTQDDMMRASVPSVRLECQRAIADFLDAETARIDALIAKKHRLMELLGERINALVERSIRDLSVRYGQRRLKTAVEAITVGIVVTPSAWYTDEGVPALRSLNVRPYGLDLTELVNLSTEGHRLHAKSALHAGDVVVVRTGQAGAAAVVPPELDNANCIDLLLIRPGLMDPNYLECVINSDWTQKHIAKYSVGTIQAHFNVSALAELPVPVPPAAEQMAVTDVLRSQMMKLDSGRQRLRRQIELLREHRQALITAAVTGEMAVPGVRQ